MFRLHYAGIGAFCFFLIMSAIDVAHAGPVLSNEVNTGVANNSSFVSPQFVTNSSSTSSTVTSSFPSTSISFTGSDATGATQTMTMTANASATAETGGILRSYSQLTVANPYYNPSNTVYVNPNFTTNPSGSPDQFEVYTATSYFDPLLQISAASPITSLNVLLTLSGTISNNPLNLFGNGSPIYTQASIVEANSLYSGACLTCGSGSVDGPGNYTGTNTRTVTLNVPVSNDTASLGILFYTFNDFYLTDPAFYSAFGFLPASPQYTSTIDFSQTLEVTGIQGLNGSNIVPLNGVTGSGGFGYPLATVPATVPDPATIFLVGVGLLGLGFTRRKRAS